MIIAAIAAEAIIIIIIGAFKLTDIVIIIPVDADDNLPDSTVGCLVCCTTIVATGVPPIRCQIQIVAVVAPSASKDVGGQILTTPSWGPVILSFMVMVSGAEGGGGSMVGS